MRPLRRWSLPNGRIVTGKTSSLLGASSALLLNALKALAGIDDDVHLISPTIIEPIQKLKIEHLGNRNPRLHTDEVHLLRFPSVRRRTSARHARWRHLPS